MIGKRVLYNSMRDCRISTLDVWDVLDKLGIEMSKRTLQNYLDSNLLTCNDDRVETVIKRMINDYKKLIKDLKESI